MKKILVMAFVACAALTACDLSGGGGSSGPQPPTAAENVLAALNGLNQGVWKIEKQFSVKQVGYAILQAPDGHFQAIDVSKFTAGGDITAYLKTVTVYDSIVKSTQSHQDWQETGSSSYLSGRCPGDTSSKKYDCDENHNSISSTDKYRVDETDYGYVTVTETIYTNPSTGLVFDIGANASKDLEAVAGAVGSQNTTAIRQQLVANYGLSQDRAADLASLAQSWQSIASSREMTQKDLAEFQVKAFGTDLNAISAAKTKAIQGNTKDYDALLKKAGQMNEISPEQAKTILESFM